MNKELKKLEELLANDRKIIEENYKEIERLNNKNEELLSLYTTEREVKDYYKNIINKLERYINEEYIYDELGMKIFDASTLQDKLQELKGADKE